MRLPQLAGCVIIAILPLLWLPVLPGRWVTWGLMVLALLIAQCRRRPAQYAALITLFLSGECSALARRYGRQRG